MPPNPQIPQINENRPECRLARDRIRQRRISLEKSRARLQQTHDLDEHEELLRNIAILQEEIDALQEELAFNGCYALPVKRNMNLKVVGVERTQSTQFFALEGTGAGANNSIPLIADKPLLTRIYLRNEFPDPVTVKGHLQAFDFNNNTLKYDIFRTQIEPIRSIRLAGLSASRRRRLGESLNFVVPAAECHGRMQFRVIVWVDGHEGDPIYEGEGVESPVEFESSRQPTIQCFRYQLTVSNPPAPATVFAAPSFADCRQTMALAQRMFPMAGMNIVDRGTRSFTAPAPMTTAADFDAVRVNIQALRDATTPTPADNDIYVAMLPNPNLGVNVWGSALAGTLVSIVDFQVLFAHELGHLLLPGDDHVNDTTCPSNPGIAQLDSNYPDYPNTAKPSGIGEFGIDTATPMQLFGPDVSDIMSYCGTRWISPYNYRRALTAGSVLDWRSAAPAPRADARKLLVAFRLFRDGRVELRSATTVPGEARRFPVKSGSGVQLELYGRDHKLLVSIEGRGPSPDLPRTSPYVDFQEMLEWHDDAEVLVVVRDDVEIARWQAKDMR